MLSVLKLMDFFVLRSKEESREDCKLMCHSECPHKMAPQLGSLVCTFFRNLISRFAVIVEFSTSRFEKAEIHCQHKSMTLEKLSSNIIR